MIKTIVLCLTGILIAMGVYSSRGPQSASPKAQTLANRQVHYASPVVATQLPTVEPLEYRPMAMEDAMAANAAEAKISDVGPAAKPFYISADSKDAATDCLTSAIYYEAASDGANGERAVAQVVVNRARHPAFPPSICGVIYQGAERTTGCQFTFSCDGSLARIPAKSAWVFARGIAKAALSGYVYAPVGLATHYHTNKVVPYWSSSLDFANLIKTQLFYRWKGNFGKPQAFARTHLQPELDVAAFNEKWQPGVSGSPVGSASTMLETIKLSGENPAKALSGNNKIPAHSNLKLDSQSQILQADQQQFILLADANKSTLIKK